MTKHKRSQHSDPSSSYKLNESNATLDLSHPSTTSRNNIPNNESFHPSASPSPPSPTLTKSNGSGIVKQDTIPDLILQYSRKCGFEVADNIATICLGKGNDTKKYVYNASDKSIKRYDAHGRAYFNEKNILKRDNEAKYLLYDLKKLHLKTSQLAFVNDLEAGNFAFNDICVNEEHESKIKSLEERLQSVSSVIEIFSKQDSNYGSSFGQQMDNCAALLRNLIQIQRGGTESTFHERLSSIYNNFDFELVEEDKRPFIKLVLDNLTDKKIGVALDEQFNKFQHLRKQKSDPFFADFLRNIEQVSFNHRKDQIEKELNRTKVIDAQIREKQEQLKGLRGNVRKQCQISQSREQRLKNLLKAQGRKSSHLCKNGLTSRKEKAMNDTFKAKLLHCPLNIEKEKTDVATLLTAVNREFQQEEKRKILSIKQNKEVTLSDENNLPVLREGIDLIEILQKKQEIFAQKLNEVFKKLHGQEAAERNDIERRHGEMAGLVEKIKRQYDALRVHIAKIEELKEKIADLKTQKSAVRDEEMSQFQQNIFVHAGGRPQVNRDDPYHNHEACWDLVKNNEPQYCRFKLATDDTVTFVIGKIKNGIRSLNETDLFKHLEGYRHSAGRGRGDGKHAESLVSAGEKAFQLYHEVERKIQQRESELQFLIDNAERNQQSEEDKRDNLCKDIVIRDNDLNGKKMELLRAEAKERVVCGQIRWQEKLKDCFDKMSKEMEDLKSNAQNKLESEQTKRDDIVKDITDDFKDFNVHDFVSKQSELIERQASCESRLTSGQITTFLNALGTSEPLTSARKAVQFQKSELTKRLSNCKNVSTRSNTELRNIELAINTTKRKCEKILKQAHNMVFERSHLEKTSSPGLWNSIKLHNCEISSLQDERRKELTKLQVKKKEFVMRQIFEYISVKSKGVTCLADAETPDDVGETSCLFKKRKFRECQNRFQGKRLLGCDYFNAVERMIRKLLDNSSETFDDIFREIASTSTHVKETHRFHLMNEFLTVGRVLDEYDALVKDVTESFQKSIDWNTDGKDRKCKILEGKKRLDGTLEIKREGVDASEEIARSRLDADIVYFYNNEVIYATPISPVRYTVSQFLKQMDNALRTEMASLLNISKSMDIANMSMDKRSSRKILYTFLAEHFGKSFCKKTNELVHCLNEQQELEITKSKLKFELENTNREIEQIERQEAVLDCTLQEIEQLQHNEQDGSERPEFDWNIFNLMEKACQSLKTKWCDHLNKLKSDIIACNQDVKQNDRHRKQAKPSAEFYETLKRRMLNSPLRIGVDNGNNCHRLCSGTPCDYLSTVEELINYHRNCDGGKNILEPFLVRRNHCRHFHQHHLREILHFIEEEVEKEKRSEISMNREKMTKLVWTKYFKEAQVKAVEEIVIAQLEKRLTLIKEYKEFKAGASFLDECSQTDSDLLDVELAEYKSDAFQLSFTRQVTALTNCFKIMETKTQPADAREYLKRCIHDTLKDFFPNSKLINVFEWLKQELNSCSGDDTPLKKLIRQKSGKMGAVKCLLISISNQYKEGPFYNINFDPVKVFLDLQLAESQKQQKEASVQVEVLERELSALKMKRIELKLEDNAALREELENLKICIGYIQDAAQISSMKDATVEYKESLRNKDDYYSFVLDNRRVCVRLLGDNFGNKSTQMKKLDDTRNLIAKHAENLLEKEVLRESITHELIRERDRQEKRNFFEIQRALFVKGIVLCGYDSFDNGILLDEIDSNIAAMTAHLIGESPFYQHGGLNETSSDVEDWTRKMRAEFDKCCGADSYKMFVEKNGIEFVANALNVEFSSDDLKIKRVNTPTKQYCFDDTDGSGKCVNLADIGGKTYFLQGRDQNPDTIAKMSNVLFMLRTDGALFKNLVLQRMEIHHRVNLQESNALQDYYNKEIASLTNIRNLKDFNCLFANNMESPHPDSLCVSLFSYLMHLEELDSPQSCDNQTIETVKELYKKAASKVFAEEKVRRMEKSDDGLVEKSKEENFLLEVIGDKEEELDELSNEIFCVEQDVEKVSDKCNSLSLEKEKFRRLFDQKREQLTEAIRNVEQRIKENQMKIRAINAEQLENEQLLADGQAEVARLEIQIIEIEKEIETKKVIKSALEKELRELFQQEKNFRAELSRVNKAKERKEKELAEKIREIEASECFAKLMKNLWLIVATKEFYENKSDILSEVYSNCGTLSSLFSALKSKLSAVHTDEDTLWNKLTDGLKFEILETQISKGRDIGGESQHESLGRFLDVFRSGFNIECEVVKDISNGKTIQKFKVVATNISSKDIKEKVKRGLEKEIAYNDNSGGLRFIDDILYCENYGVTAIHELPVKLKDLIERKIELKSKSEEVQTKKTGKWKNAAEVINSLKLTYVEVMTLYIDEIEVIASGTFFLNEPMIYPGIDITIGSLNMVCIGDNLVIDTSGSNGENYVHPASGGISKRHNKDQPRGDKGYDGFDGNNGGNAGHIVIKVENSIKNLEGLKSVKANGGNGAEGQLGGDGDKGKKGANGKNGKARDTTWFGRGQTTIGFGSPGEPGGKGGACGDSGRPGEGGAAGAINITHKGVKLSFGERNPGRTAKNVLDHKRPKGGEGGEPGLYGMDEVKDKKGFFSKTKTFHTVVDREQLIKDNPEFKNDISDDRDIKKEDTWGGLFVSGLTGGVICGTAGGVIGGVVRGLGRGLIGAGAGLVGGAVIGMVCYKFRDKRIGYNEVQQQGQYRDRDRNRNNRRGENNETEAKLRNDTRISQEEQRHAVNSDTLNSKMSEKVSIDNEISGDRGLAEQIADIVLEREQIEFEIQNHIQDAANLESEIENVSLASVTKASELEKVQQELACLERRETSLNMARIASVDRVLRALQKSQHLRDQKETTEQKLNELMGLIHNYQELQKELHDNQNDHFKIFDDYIDAVREDLQRLRLYLKTLKADYNERSRNLEDWKRKYEDLRMAQVSHTEIEIELDEEVEQEFEIALEQEMTTEIEFDDKSKRNGQRPQEETLEDRNVDDIESLRVNTIEGLSKLIEETPFFANANLANDIKTLSTFFTNPKMFYSDTLCDAKQLDQASTKILRKTQSVDAKKLENKEVFMNVFQIFSKFYKILDKIRSNLNSESAKSFDTKPLKVLTLKLITQMICPSVANLSGHMATGIADGYLKL